MGLGIVLLFWGAVGIVLAALAAAVLTRLVRHALRGAPPDKIARAAAVLPFVSLGWIGLIFIVLAAVNGLALGRDAILGDTWYTPLPDGYTLMMMDTPDRAALCPGQAEFDMCPDGGDLTGVTQLQLAGPFLLGQDAARDTPGRPYFLFDKRSHSRQGFGSRDALARAAAVHGIKLDLRRVADIYLQYRFTWVDALAAIIALGPPLLAFALLCARLLRARRKAAA